MYRPEFCIVEKFTTSSRTVVSDGRSLFISTECPKCGGDGEVTYSTHGLSHWGSGTYQSTCDECFGCGVVHEQTDEDELGAAIDRVAA